ncbi:MAG: phosphoribosyltransferase [Deltaproteobacteria bacterium]|nr:phosphoribosyltransferase [Deltaproteobacteria bacterium]
MLHVSPDDFLLDTVRLGKLVYQSGFRPKHAISIWRGGTPVGLGVHAYFRSRGFSLNHTTIATDSYLGIGQQGEVTVKNLEHLVDVICREDGLLIIDDVYESGNTIKGIVSLLRQMARKNAPEDIRVATVHSKPEKHAYQDLPLYALQSIDEDVWIDYPHEIADLVEDGDADDTRIRNKSETLWRLLRGEEPTAQSELRSSMTEHYQYVSAQQLLFDSVRLGIQIAKDDSWHPNFMIALWPGGVIAGLPVHETYKYFLRKQGDTRQTPDHISINASPTRASYRSSIIGLGYLADNINSTDNVLIIDTTFRAGRLVNDVVTRLKELLRRNLDHNRVRVASVYYNPNDDSTWTGRPDIARPHYFQHKTTREIIYPASFHKLPDPVAQLKTLNPALWEILYADVV